jgi:hypothetical protein
MHLLDANFFTALPAIVLGIVCMGIVYFLVFGLISKATGKSMGYRGGITYKGSTLADPDTLDNVAVGIRKVFDKKYKVNKQIQEEFNAELNITLSPIEKKLAFLSYATSTNKLLRIMADSYRDSETKYEILSIIGKTDYSQGYKQKGIFSEGLEKEYLEKLKNLQNELLKQKEEITALIKAKYEKKTNEINKYL